VTGRVADPRRRRRVLILVVGLLLTVLAGLAAPSDARPPGDTGPRDASAGTGQAQTEQTIAVDPRDPRNVLIGYISGLSVSHDGGRSWRRSSVSCAGDNNPEFDRGGTAYFECDNNGVEVYVSTNGGDYFSGPINAVSGLDNNGDLVDRPWLVRGADGHTVVLGWESFFTNPVGWVYVKVSKNGGRTWGPARRVDDLSADPAEQDPRQRPVVGADGTIYVAYASGHNPFPTGQTLPTSFVVARSRDAGASWRRTVAAADITRSSSPQEESEAISSLAADQSRRRPGHVALAWADQRGGNESRILVATSVDGGAHWSGPKDVSGAPPGSVDQRDHPEIGFAPDGRLFVVWRDRRCCGGSWSSAYQILARAVHVGAHGVAGFGRIAEVTDGPQQPGSSNLLDEYLGMTVGPEGLSVAWNQPKNGVATTFFRRLPLSTR
jgi:hypothetical protein